MRRNPRHDARFFKYQNILLSRIDPTSQSGLEIGVLDLPFITPDLGLVQYADYFSTGELRERAASAPGHSADFVQPVDFVLRNTPLQTLPTDYDWVATSHFIEHVPDFIGWLKLIGDRLVAHGTLFCVIPDGRYTFDINRPLSTLGKILQDHLHGHAMPTFSEVFDATYYSRSVCAADIWAGKIAGDPTFHTDFAAARQRASLAGESYIDVHTNVFTPKSFFEIVRTLIDQRLIPFILEEIGETDPGGIDFHVILQKNG